MPASSWHLVLLMLRVARSSRSFTSQTLGFTLGLGLAIALKCSSDKNAIDMLRAASTTGSLDLACLRDEGATRLLCPFQAKMPWPAY